MKKFLLSLMTLLALVSTAFAKQKKDDKTGPVVVCSTSWTAAYADLAGAKNLTIIAPADLQHPPEYEITVSDIQKIGNSDYFIYAGFERMMKTLGDSTGKTTMVQITCYNSLENIETMCRKLAQIFGTEKECEKNLEEYKAKLAAFKSEINRKYGESPKVYCNKNQVALAKDLGFEIAGIFGPGPLTSDQLASAAKSEYSFIIDNCHNPVGKPLVEVSKNKAVVYLEWRNFPSRVSEGILLEVITLNFHEIMR